MKEVIPDIVVSRLPQYLQTLNLMKLEGKQTTSSQELSERLGFSAAQVRKDLSQFGGFGKQGTGYSISFLSKQLESILNIDRIWDIVLVGVGDLGRAIANYQGFTNRGFRIALILDNDPKKIGDKVGELEIQDFALARELIGKAGIQIAMLAVPASSAQTVAEEVVQAGVKAILNYAPTPLKLPPNILIQYLDPLIQLQHMTYYLAK